MGSLDDLFNADREEVIEELAAERAAAFGFTPITPEELAAARLTPRTIVPGLLYADVRTRIAPGGIGKTTLALSEAVKLALGRDIWGLHPEHPVKTILVTKEDSRELLVARVRELMAAMELSWDERLQVLRNVRILDLSGDKFRLSTVTDDVVEPHRTNLVNLLDIIRDWKPDWVIFDPLVSFGVGESRVNDAEQGIIEAFRILRNSLDCCIEGIHHTGKVNARDGAMDQYAGRGGSALSDGCRMVVVIRPLNAAEWHKATGEPLVGIDTGLVMSLPKLSYVGPQEPIYIRRRGYLFTHVQPVKQDDEERSNAYAEKLLDFIRGEYEAGRRYSDNELDECALVLGMKRTNIRDAKMLLKVEGRIEKVAKADGVVAHYRPSKPRF
jgi:RecA-family ATPase